MFDYHRHYRRPIARSPFFYRARKNCSFFYQRFCYMLQFKLGRFLRFRGVKSSRAKASPAKPVTASRMRSTFGLVSSNRTKPYRARHFRRPNISSYGRPRRPLLRAILCGAIIWAVLPIGVAILNSDGASFKGDFKPYPIKASKVSSAVEKQEKSNKYSNFYSASSSKTQQASLTSLPVDWQKFSGHMQIRLLDHKTKQLCHLDLEEYIVGVVAAEMPASFDIEALKAQAVAARTYAVRRVVQGASSQVLAQNQQAQISSDHNINQAWIDEKERENRWGSNFPGNEAKIRQAVGQTQGIILLYKGQIIDPLYHASCGGERTEDVSNVWSGQSVPYLQSMKCSGHQDKHQNNQTMLDLITVDAKLGTTLNELPAASLFGKRSEDVCQIVDKTKTGRVMSASIMGKSYSGSELRTKLELPSTKFEMDFKDGQLEITNQGYGHGVGMCQYGAADFAAKGESWQKILLHYYKDVQPARITIKQ